MARSQQPACRLAVVAMAAALMLAWAADGSVAGDHEQTIELTFPTEPSASFSDDYDVPRGEDDAHRATDLFAPMGAPVYAARAGRVTWVAHHRTAGWALHVRGAGERTYAYYHLGPAGGQRAEAIAAGVSEGATVDRGQLIGYVGDSGNAVGGPPHLHFEVHDPRVTDPYGGDHLNPVASLRAALARGDRIVAGGGSRLAPVLRSGARGPRVAAWQHELNAHRARSILTDGIFGPQTVQATRELQHAEGVGVDGVVGPRTRAASAAALPPGSPALGLLTAGDRGPRVAEWQQQLDTVLARPVAVDGIFGPQTGRATRDLQRSRGLLVDGIVGPQTRRAMSQALR